MFTDALRHARPRLRRADRPSSTPTRSRWRAWPRPAARSRPRSVEHHTMADGYLPSPLVLADRDGGAHHHPADHGRGADPAAVRPDPPRRGHGRPRHHQRRSGQLRRARSATGPRSSSTTALDFRTGAAGSSRSSSRCLLRAKTGEPFEHEGRRIHVTPAAGHARGPAVMLGRRKRRGGAERAGRLRPGLLRPRRRPGARGGLRRARPGPTATSPASACCRPPTSRPPCSSPTTSTRRGTSSARTSCTTCSATPHQRGQHAHRQPLERDDGRRSCAPRTEPTASSPSTRRSR